MNEQKRKLFLIKIAYWLGIGADALWGIGVIAYSVRRFVSVTI